MKTLTPKQLNKIKGLQTNYTILSESHNNLNKTSDNLYTLKGTNNQINLNTEDLQNLISISDNGQVEVSEIFALMLDKISFELHKIQKEAQTLVSL